ncbi:hypothetical protein AQUCO_04300119v1 [Aquilegia coerulea]|uniref:F-box domain-containing protein n=1 Tax=Aquilegia coerulea TaxID=218851 RepID=A0A2G5CNP9_AQUCA|nr:hypothetical protein AQUCO_04300118v1 [Aquilegia coerulea]PIA32936.1 hypothetical protein AQUCO_04300119v1 [Aquilegia coerulea]
MGERKWEDMKTDCLVEVFEKVGLKHLMLDVPLVCKSWHRASLIPECWKFLDFTTVTKGVQVSDPTEMIMVAVTRSCGTAIKVVLPKYCTVEHLVYISDQCPAVKALIVPYIEASLEEEECIPKLLAKFKELEMLRLGCDINFEKMVTEIVTNCKNFRALFTSGNIHMEEASTIVTFLPNLKYLGLRGSYLPRECLIHILNGCKNLVFLDVGNCIGFDEDDDEISKLASHIKTFKSEGSMLYDYEDDYLDCNDYEDFTGNGSD